MNQPFDPIAWPTEDAEPASTDPTLVGVALVDSIGDLRDRFRPVELAGELRAAAGALLPLMARALEIGRATQSLEQGVEGRMAEHGIELHEISERDGLWQVLWALTGYTEVNRAIDAIRGMTTALDVPDLATATLPEVGGVTEMTNVPSLRSLLEAGTDPRSLGHDVWPGLLDNIADAVTATPERAARRIALLNRYSPERLCEMATEHNFDHPGDLEHHRIDQAWMLEIYADPEVCKLLLPLLDPDDDAEVIYAIKDPHDFTLHVIAEAVREAIGNLRAQVDEEAPQALAALRAAQPEDWTAEEETAWRLEHPGYHAYMVNLYDLRALLDVADPRRWPEG